MWEIYFYFHFISFLFGGTIKYICPGEVFTIRATNYKRLFVKPRHIISYQYFASHSSESLTSTYGYKVKAGAHESVLHLNLFNQFKN